MCLTGFLWVSFIVPNQQIGVRLIKVSKLTIAMCEGLFVNLKKSNQH